MTFKIEEMPLELRFLYGGGSSYYVVDHEREAFAVQYGGRLDECTVTLIVENEGMDFFGSQICTDTGKRDANNRVIYDVAFHITNLSIHPKLLDKVEYFKDLLREALTLSGYYAIAEQTAKVSVTFQDKYFADAIDHEKYEDYPAYMRQKAEWRLQEEAERTGSSRDERYENAMKFYSQQLEEKSKRQKENKQGA